MAYMGNLKRGDRVRVTIEGEVEFGSSFGVDLEVGDGVVHLREGTWRGVEFEKIEPPVEVFKPGDRIRHRDIGFEVTIGDTGYLVHHTTGNHSWRPWRNEPFTSELYERVSLDSGD